MGRRLPLVGILLLLVGGGVALALLGWRTLGLERAEARRSARARAAHALEQAARDLVALRGAWPVEPAERWTFWRPPAGPAPARGLWGEEARHALEAGRAAEAVPLYERALAEETDAAVRTRLGIEAALALWRSGDPTRADQRLAQALAPAGPKADPRDRLEAAYLRARLGVAPGALGEFLATVAHGRLLGPVDAAGPDTLLLALAADPPAPLEPAEQARLAAAAARARAGRVVRAGVGPAALGVVSGRIVLQDDVGLRAYAPAALAAWQAEVHGLPLALAPAGAPAGAGGLSHPLPGPLSTLELSAPEPTPLPGGLGGAWLLLGGLALYAGGVLLLLQALTRARRAQRMQGEFVAAVSHELKTPIASVRAMAEALGDGAADDPERTRRYAARIESEMLRLGRTVRNVLDVGRIERLGGLPIRREPCDPAALVAAAAEAFGPALERRGMVLEWRAAPAPGPLPLDREALVGVLVNLLDNAAKFSPPQGRVELVGAPAPGAGYRIHVADRGPGIAGEERTRLFRRFERLGAALAGAVPGVGLGLHVAAQVVRAHGGSLRHEPRPGGGSVFVVEVGPAP